MGKLGIIGTVVALVGVLGMGAVYAFEANQDQMVTEQLRDAAPVIEALPEPTQLPEPSTSSSPTPAPSTPAEPAPEPEPVVRQYTITISNSGGGAEMDECLGGFTEMTVYQGLGDKRLLSAHNICGGDVVLAMELGDHVIIEGEGEYVITDTRDTPKKTTTEAIHDMDGSVLLQTCYHHENKMKFVALTPVAP